MSEDGQLRVSARPMIVLDLDKASGSEAEGEDARNSPGFQERCFH